jgi:hypothetical protein
MGSRTENVLCGSWVVGATGVGVGDKKNKRSSCSIVLSTRWWDVVVDVWRGSSRYVLKVQEEKG